MERPVSPRKTLGEELLGDSSILSEEPTARIPEALFAEQSSLDKEEELKVSTPIQTIATPEPIQESVATKPSKPAEQSEESVAQDMAKKKQKKVSYEELDEKLNKLLSDDII